MHFGFCSVNSGEDSRHELEEYQESSREVEAELETQLKQAEHQVRELRSTNHRLLVEHTSLKVNSRVPSALSLPNVYLIMNH